VIATFDDNQRWFRNTIQCGWVKEEFSKKMQLKFVLALLNSSYLRFLYKNIVNEAAGKVFPQFKLTHLKKLPIRIISQTEQNKFVSLVDQILVEKNTDKFIKLKAKIDEMVFDLYDIPKSKRKEIEGSSLRKAA
jgi:restriction endonuclease S subunit